MSETCPKCGAEEFSPSRDNEGSTRTYWRCGSHSEGKQSDACRINELTAQLAASEKRAANLLSAATNAAHLLNGYHPGYVGLNADGNVLFTQYDVAREGHNLKKAIDEYAIPQPKGVDEEQEAILTRQLTEGTECDSPHHP